jgi:hypothetical protein
MNRTSSSSDSVAVYCTATANAALNNDHQRLTDERRFWIILDVNPGLT